MTAGTATGAGSSADPSIEVETVKLIAKKTILLHPDDAEGRLLGRFVQPGQPFEIADEKAAAILVRDGEAETPEAYAAREAAPEAATEGSPEGSPEGAAEASAEDANDAE